VIGFSAGGHLAGDITTEYDQTVYTRMDEADGQSARPDFSALIYPVASLRRQITHGGSRNRLLGPNSSEALAHSRSPAANVNADTPPSFIVHSIDDETVPVDCAFDWITACRAAKVPVEAHLFEKGGHGYGLGLPAEMPASRWPELLALWMRQQPGG
jgi:acetyl esterase/lipase